MSAAEIAKLCESLPPQKKWIEGTTTPLRFSIGAIRARREGDMFNLHKDLPRVLFKDKPVGLSAF